MANYVAHYNKKRQALKRRKHDLLRLLSGKAPEERLLKAAEEVRHAQIRALRAQRATVPPAAGAILNPFDVIDQQIAKVMASTAASLLDEFRASANGRT